MKNEQKSLVRVVLEAYDEWKKTGRLPNGELWSLGQEQQRPVGRKFLVSNFNQTICSKFNMNRKTATTILLDLEKRGKIRVV